MNPKKDFFDALSEWVKIPVAIVSGILTGKLLAATLGFDGLDEKLIVIVTAAVFNISEVVLFRRWYGQRDAAALLIGILIATASIAGSIGYFQVQLERSILESDEYRQQKQMIDNLLIASNPERHPDTYLVATKNLKRELPKLAEIRHNGAGIGSAIYNVFSRLTGWSIEKSALFITVFIALVIELVLIYSAVKPYTLPAPTPKKTAPERTPIQELNARKKEKQNDRLKTVKNVIENYPNLTVTQQAEKSGLSKATFIKYRKLLYSKALV